MRELIIGDIHGGFKALKQCLKRSNFDKDTDRLICLGDVADGWPDVYECFEELFTIKNLVYIRGNHDQWLKDWLDKGKKPDVWTLQGGKNTQNSYLKKSVLVCDMVRHLKFLKKTEFYHIDEKNRVFVHGGISQKGIHPKDTDKVFLSWDRELWDNRHNISDSKNLKKYTEIYVGHTSIWRFSKHPSNHANVWFMDTGGGWEGKLTIMDINTKEFWQSDRVSDLYDKGQGRI